MPRRLCEVLARRELEDLTIVANNAGTGETGLSCLFKHGCVSHLIASFPSQTGADHFFRSHMEEFGDITDKYVKDRLSQDSGKVRKVKRDRRRRRKKKNVAEAKPERNYFPVKSLASFDN